jgi:sulfate permease, SulP family
VLTHRAVNRGTVNQETHDPSQAGPPPVAGTARLPAAFPMARWLPAYQWSWLGLDLWAGLTLAAYAIPVSLAYASLAGLPSQTGIYCYLLAGLGYVLFGSSRHLAVGPTAAISTVVGLTLATAAPSDPAAHAAMASLTALMVAALFGLAWLLRLSQVVNFVSDSILAGFKAGAALVIALTVLPKLLGVPGGGRHFLERLWVLSHQLGDTNLAVLAIGVGALVLLLAGDWLLPGRPFALVVVALSIVVVSVAGLEGAGVPVVGRLPAGLPRLGLPQVEAAQWRELAGLASACALLCYVESITAARAYALAHRYEIDARQELLGLGMANLAVALGHGYPVAGGLSQTAVNERAGARSSLSLVFASTALGAVLIFATGLFRNLPEVVLAAVVLVAVIRLVDLAELRHLWRVSRLDFNAALVAMTGVVLLGILGGVVLAMVASLLMLLHRTMDPHVAFLGRIPGTDRFSDLARHPDNERIPGVLPFRVEAALLYFNIDHVLGEVHQEVRRAPDLKLVVCDLSTSPYVDVAGARKLVRLHDELDGLGIDFRVAEMHAEVRDILRAEGIEDRVGHISRKVSLAEVIRDFHPA